MIDKYVYVIINPDCYVTEWQYECILKLNDYRLIFLKANEIQNKVNFKRKRKYLRNFFYYLINLVSIKQRKIKLNFKTFRNSSVKNIYYTYKKNSWQELTHKSINKIVSSNPLFIYKCGMDLLYINKKLKKIPILSHHHGDPSNFRGRPSGFYEILRGKEKMGQIIQIISNKLDAGKILFYGETKVYPWSYKKTLKESYSVSPIILEKALINFKKGIFIDKECNGENFKLPSNLLSIYFIYKEFICLISKILYGLFFEKFWQVAYVKDFQLNKINEPKDFFSYIHKLSNNFQTLKISKGYDFYADPFILNSSIIVEGLNSFSCKGNLLIIDTKSHEIVGKLKYKNQHISYPYTKESNGNYYIYPDSGSLKETIFYKGTSPNYLQKFSIKKFKSGLIDPSVVEHNGLFYLFANYPNESSVLRLWVSKSPYFDDIFEHNYSPINIGPEGGRSGGRIFKFKEKFYRFGQNSTGDYGNGLILFEIIKLTQDCYVERQIFNYRFKGLIKGPHNIDFTSNLLTWDFYIDKFNFFAGLKRIIGRL